MYESASMATVHGLPAIFTTETNSRTVITSLVGISILERVTHKKRIARSVFCLDG